MLSKIYLCPADRKHGCTWEGASDDIFQHFTQEHEELLFMTNSIDINLLDAPENLLCFINTEIYLLQMKIHDLHLEIWLRYLGPANIASNLTYDIDLISDNKKIGKEHIKTHNGCFLVALKSIHDCFGNIPNINCVVLVCGDFSSSSEESVLITEEHDKQNIENIEETERTRNFDSRPSKEDKDDLVVNLEELFSIPKQENSPTDLRETKKFYLHEINRATWYGNDSPRERNSTLSRSQTFSSEDIKKNTIFKRHASMRSLTSIAETDLDLDLELKCSNCENHLAPPIFLCHNNHNLCSACYRENTICKICHEEITADRNEELEERSLNYLYTCINKKHGCLKKLPYTEISDHEINCTFCQFYCPVEECGFKASYKEMVAHLSLIHSSVKMFQSFIAVFQKYQELFLVNEQMGIFYCNWVQRDNIVLWKAKFCGPKNRKFFCELKFKGKNFRKPLLLTKYEDYYFKEMLVMEMKEQKLKAKNSILTITR